MTLLFEKVIVASVVCVGGIVPWGIDGGCELLSLFINKRAKIMCK